MITCDNCSKEIDDSKEGHIMYGWQCRACGNNAVRADEQVVMIDGKPVTFYKCKSCNMLMPEHIPLVRVCMDCYVEITGIKTISEKGHHEVLHVGKVLSDTRFVYPDDFSKRFIKRCAEICKKKGYEMVKNGGD